MFWGEGLLASVDGLRFVVPVRTINVISPAPRQRAWRTPRRQTSTIEPVVVMSCVGSPSTSTRSARRA
jgi:hypothetical protein